MRGMRARAPNDGWFGRRRWLVRVGWVGLLLLVAWSLHGRTVARWTGRVVAVAPDGSVVLRDDAGQRRAVALRGVRPIEGEQAALVAYLQDHLLGSTERRAVTVVHHAGDRRAGYLYAGSMLINEHVIAAGHARAVRNDQHPIRDWLVRMERQARRQERGLWATAGRDAALTGDLESP